MKELDLKIRRRKSETGLNFVAGSSPPRIEHIQSNSYFLAKLFVGDQILEVNSKVWEINARHSNERQI